MDEDTTTTTQPSRAQIIGAVSAQCEQRYKDGEPVGVKRTLLNLERIIAGDPWFCDRLRYNGLTECVEWDGVRMRDDHVTRIRLAIARDYGPQFGAADTQDLLVEVARQRTYHPIAEYLDGLLWDNVPRIDGFLSGYLGVEDTPLHRVISRRWFVSCVARAMGKGERPVKCDNVLILVGRQGARKSTAFRVLASADWFSDTALDLRSKDAYQAIRGIFLMELAELASLAPRSAETVKAFLSAPTDRYRPPYGRNVVESHRQCVFVGTTNAATFLSDPTGARRFWPVRVGEIDIDKIAADRDFLWAEAVEAYRAGEPWWLTPEQDRQLVQSQEQYQHHDPWIVVVERWLADAVNRNEAARGMQVGEVLTRAVGMDADRQKKGHEMRLGAALQAMGWAKRRARRGRRQLTLWFPGDSVSE